MTSDTGAQGTETSSGIVVDQVVKTYKGGRVKALNGLSLHIRRGEAFGLIGPNGAGKTTFFGCLLAFLKTDSGSITIDGKPADALATRAIVGYLPERLNFDKWMSGLEFMHFHHELAGLPQETRKSDTEELLTRVALKPDAWKLAIKKYSRGMLQRIGLAQALLHSPQYLLLDEPASGVDPHGVLLVRGILKELKQKGCTIILNSHQLDQVEKVCDRVGFINAGKVESIENMHAGEEVIQREVLLKWLAGVDVPPTSRLRELVADCGGEVDVLKDGDKELTVKLGSNEAIARMIKKMVQSGFPLVHASSKDGRLEKLFLQVQDKQAGEAAAASQLIASAQNSEESAEGNAGV